jgi:hypothetical protein
MDGIVMASDSHVEGMPQNGSLDNVTDSESLDGTQHVVASKGAMPSGGRANLQNLGSLDTYGVPSLDYGNMALPESGLEDQVSGQSSQCRPTSSGGRKNR